MSQAAALAYAWGQDAFGIERAIASWASRLAPPDASLDTWRVNLDDESGDDGASPGTGASSARRRERTLGAIEERLAAMPLFGAGTLVLIRQPAALLAEAGARDRLVELVGRVPPGNALGIADLVAAGAKAPAAKGVLRDAVAAAGGIVMECPIPTGGRLEAWLMERAAELGSSLDLTAARLLTERVGGNVRESDVDRRRRTELANAELEKLALYRPGGTIERADVEALVAEAIPGSMWAFLDAVGARSGPAAVMLAERLLADATPLPVLVAQLHRRLRDLILVREHIEAGSRPPQIVKELKLQPFRAQKLSEQARRWSLAALDEALADLLEVDLRTKGIALDGATLQMSAAIDALTLQWWLARHAAPPTAAGSARPR
jgi:DNA polymerase III delta subunit